MIRMYVYYASVAITGLVVLLFGLSNVASGDAPILTIFLLVGGSATVAGAVYALVIADEPEEYLPSDGMIIFVTVCGLVALFVGVSFVFEFL